MILQCIIWVRHTFTNCYIIIKSEIGKKSILTLHATAFTFDPFNNNRDVKDEWGLRKNVYRPKTSLKQKIYKSYTMQAEFVFWKSNSYDTFLCPKLQPIQNNFPIENECKLCR